MWAALREETKPVLETLAAFTAPAALAAPGSPVGTGGR